MSHPQKIKLKKEMPGSLRWRFQIAEWLGLLDSQVKKRLFSFLNEGPVDYAVVLAMDGVYNRDGYLDEQRTNFYVPNEYVIGLAKECKKVIPGASIHPLRKEWEEEFERVVASGARLIKWLPSSQGFDPADSRILPFYRKLAAKKIPLLVHTGFEHIIVAPSEQQVFGEPKRLNNALEAGVTVIMAHSGTSGGPGEPEYWNDFIELARRYPHCYGDMAAFTHWTRVGILPKIIHHDWVHERLIHGSDATLQPSLDQISGLVGRDLAERLKSSQNPIYKDWKLKKALGFPNEIFTRAGRLLRLD